MRTLHLTLTAIFLVSGIVLGFGSFVVLKYGQLFMIVALISFAAAIGAAKLADQN